MWLKEFKIALIEKNTEKLALLMEDVPQLKSQKEIDSALHLIQEATAFVQALKDEAEISLVKIEKNRKFLSSMDSPYKSKFDINS